MANRIKWSGLNLEILKKNYPKYGYKAIQVYFPELSKNSIIEAARRHGIKSMNPTGRKKKLAILR